MTKTELYEKLSVEVSQILEGTKVPKKVKEQIQAVLDEYVKPKSGGGNVINPPKEIDGKKYYFCRFHQCYEPEEDMVMSKGKSKGYCKAAISKWNKLNSQIKKLDMEASELLLEGKMEEAQAKAQEAKKLKDKLNLPSTYNYVEDWTQFNKCDSEIEIAAIEEKYDKLKAIK